MATVCRPVVQPPTWRASLLYNSRGRVAQIYLEALVTILSPLYDLHGLQWDYSVPGHHTGNHQVEHDKIMLSVRSLFMCFVLFLDKTVIFSP